MASAAVAGPTVGVHKDDSYANYPGYRYVVKVESGFVRMYGAGDVFPSFCLETNERTYDDTLFNVTISDREFNVKRDASCNSKWKQKTIRNQRLKPAVVPCSGISHPPTAAVSIHQSKLVGIEIGTNRKEQVL